MNEFCNFYMTVPYSIRNLICGEVKKGERANLNINGNEFVIENSVCFKEVLANGAVETFTLAGTIHDLNEHKNLLISQLDNLIKEVESVKEKLRDMK